MSLENFWDIVAGRDSGINGDAYTAIVDRQKSSGQRVVLLVDNLGYVFDRLPYEDQYKLRGQLNQNNAPILIASSNKVLREVTDYKAAFFDGLKILYIKPLDLMKMRSENRERMRRLSRLLPKTPRAFRLIKRILAESKSSEDDIRILIDFSAPMYQVIYDNYNQQTQRIITTLAENPAGMSLEGLRIKLNQPGGSISSYLKKMVDNRVVIKDSESSRRTKYRIADPVMSLWLQSGSACKIDKKQIECLVSGR